MFILFKFTKQGSNVKFKNCTSIDDSYVRDIKRVSKKDIKEEDLCGVKDRNYNSNEE